jgi:hypothetical protein
VPQDVPPNVFGMEGTFPGAGRGQLYLAPFEPGSVHGFEFLWYPSSADVESHGSVISLIIFIVNLGLRRCSGLAQGLELLMGQIQGVEGAADSLGL